MYTYKTFYQYRTGTDDPCLLVPPTPRRRFLGGLTVGRCVTCMGIGYILNAYALMHCVFESLVQREQNCPLGAGGGPVIHF